MKEPRQGNGEQPGRSDGENGSARDAGSRTGFGNDINPESANDSVNSY